MQTRTFFAQDQQGNALPNASVTVYNVGTLDLATVFDANGQAKSNPFQATAVGAIVFSVANGKYDIAIQEDQGTGTQNVSGVQFFDPADQALTLSDIDDAGTAAAEDATSFATAAQGAKADTAVQPEDIGTAAAQDVSAFATAVQGAKADTAVQPGELPPNLTELQIIDGASTVFGLMSGQRFSQGFDANEQQIGVGQTWQAPTRSKGTTYQNTTGKPIQVFVQGDNYTFQVSDDASTWLSLTGSGTSGFDRPTWATVPDGIYYRAVNDGAGALAWVELR